MLPQPITRQYHPMSNTERQRRFRERNPGYYTRLRAKRNAKLDAMLAAQTAAAEAAAAEASRAPLLLPAPIETIELVGLTTIPTLAQLHASREALAAVDRA